MTDSQTDYGIANEAIRETALSGPHEEFDIEQATNDLPDPPIEHSQECVERFDAHGRCTCNTVQCPGCGYYVTVPEGATFTACDSETAPEHDISRDERGVIDCCAKHAEEAVIAELASPVNADEDIAEQHGRSGY
jgi:hypothetical protein